MTAPEIADPEGDLAPEEFHTPNLKTIADVSRFTKLPDSSQMKSLVMVADGKPVLAMLRGDHQLSETKLRAFLGASELRAAQPQEILAGVRRERRFPGTHRREEHACACRFRVDRASQHDYGS